MNEILTEAPPYNTTLLQAPSGIKPKKESMERKRKAKCLKIFSRGEMLENV